MGELAATLEELNKNPLFRMSLGSKELFHSNFIAWLIETDNQFLRTWLGYNEHIERILNLNHPISVDRERGNTDLWIQSGEESIIIENKVKSVPDRRQLDEYVSKHGTKKIYYLLSLEKPAFFAEGYHHTLLNDETVIWHYASYGDLSRAIESHQWRDANTLTYILDYVNFTKALNEFAEYLPVNENDMYDFAWGHTSHNSGCIDLRKYRLHDLYTKHKMDSFSQLLRKKDALKDTVIDWGFTNGTGIITVRKSFGKAQIGIQLQNNAFRMFSFWPEDGLRSIAFRSSLLEKGLWFDFSVTGIPHAETEIKGKGRDKSGFNNYSGVFFYKYIRINNRSVNDVIGYFVHTFEHVFNNEANFIQLVNEIK